MTQTQCDQGMPTVCIVNDDGPKSMGLLRLSEALTGSMNVVVVVPIVQQSRTGNALTLDRPIRIDERTDSEHYRFIVHDGLPADSVMIALSMIDKVDLFISGIDAGANLGDHRMLKSGTIGVALEAAIQGFPAIAVSLAVDPDYWLSNMIDDSNLERVCDETVSLSEQVLRKGLPRGIDALNVNFPLHLTDESRLVVSKPMTVGVANRMEQRTDPNGCSHYWIRGGETESQPSDDALKILERNNISISPVVIRGVREEDMENLRLFLEL